MVVLSLALHFASSSSSSSYFYYFRKSVDLTHTYIRTYIHTYIHTYVHTYMQVWHLWWLNKPARRALCMLSLMVLKLWERHALFSCAHATAVYCLGDVSRNESTPDYVVYTYQQTVYETSCLYFGVFLPLMAFTCVFGTLWYTTLVCHKVLCFFQCPLIALNMPGVGKSAAA